MKIGTVLQLEMKDRKSGQLQKYHCKIIEKNENYFIIDYPIHTVTKKTAFFTNGTLLTVTYLENDKVVYQFPTEIIGKVKLNIPALAIKKPDDNYIERVQRREYVRIDTTLDIAVHSVNHLFSPFVTITTDLSGGGMAIIATKNISLEIGYKADIWLPLQRQNNDYHYINGQTEIVSIREANNKNNLISLKFISINAQDRQQIIWYCFEKQRESLQKELI